MPNPHYQRVLEQDQQLPLPLRCLTRAMSSWWTISVLGVCVVGYVAAAHAPISGRYLWQHRLIDTTQQQMLTWLPLMAAAWLLAVAVVWSAFRRLPMRWDSPGRFVAVLGLAIVLVSQSWAFKMQTTGVAAVPIARQSDDPSAGNTPPLAPTNSYGDTHERVLVVMAGGQPTAFVPLLGLPRWNDAAGNELPTIKIHDDPRVAAALGFGTRITPVAYIADGTLTENPDGTQTATPTPANDRDTTTLPYPANALLAVEITTEAEDGKTRTTTCWIPFEPASTNLLLPDRFFQVEGVGSVGLAFRPASKKLPFAVAASQSDSAEKWAELKLHLSDADASGQIAQPAEVILSGLESMSTTYRALDDDGRSNLYLLGWMHRFSDDSEHAYLLVSTNTSNPFITAGLITFVIGIALDFLMGWLAPAPKRNTVTQSQTPTKAEPDGDSA